ncbi:lasso peptide biosynthesis PqqD family chaperone [Romboutsia lituseburensis]|uniref:lasso peptide biosynthesis PqqD family chaperone n=1 Tax=Romboutsia lituseburensis TaxID=1537 RepID=UPI00215B1404|nr:lasso peptide biosynthesis PqqD family chaperone [Romboutsia lituseburensis]MCR8746858.1 lasso peptide biosynthesis PqqD family chaperone [Romboutsia lituseburensis]
MITLETIVSHRGDLDATDLDGEIVMMDLDKGQYFALNGVGSRIWQELEQPIKVGEIVDTLIGEYDVDRETCEKSVLEFVMGLDNAELLSMG